MYKQMYLICMTISKCFGKYRPSSREVYILYVIVKLPSANNIACLFAFLALQHIVVVFSRSGSGL